MTRPAEQERRGVALLGAAHVHVADHLAVIDADPGLRLVAVWDRDPARTASFPPGLVAAAAADAVARADLVVVDSVTAEHAELVPQAAGRAMFVEKPLGRTAADARSLAGMIDAAGAPFATGFFLRCLPALRRARAALHEGRLGRLVAVHAHFTHPGLTDGAFTGPAVWLLDPDRAGMGAFGDLGTHLLDMLRWLRPGQGLDVEHCRLDAGEGTDVGGTAVLAWADGVMSTVRVGWVTRPGGFGVVLEGTEATATVAGGTLTVQGNWSGTWPGDGPDARQVLAAFVAALRGVRPGWEPPTTGDAVRVAELLDAAQRCAASHSRRSASGRARSGSW